MRPKLPLALPQARTKNGVGQTIKDLSEHPWAGADVTMTLVARDEAGNEGTSEPFELQLPERIFTKPLARALDRAAAQPGARRATRRRACSPRSTR